MIRMSFTSTADLTGNLGTREADASIVLTYQLVYEPSLLLKWGASQNLSCSSA